MQILHLSPLETNKKKKQIKNSDSEFLMSNQTINYLPNHHGKKVAGSSCCSFGSVDV